MAKDVSEFFASENIDHAHLCGHSITGKVALQRAADNASSIDGLVVVEIAPQATPTARTPETFQGLVPHEFTSFSK